MLPQAEFQISDWIFRTPLKFWSGWYIKHPVWTRFIIAQNGSPDMVFLFYPYMAWYRHMDTGFRIVFGFRSWPQVKLTNLGQVKISFFQPPSSILCHGLIRKGTGTPCPYRQKHKYSHISQPISTSRMRGPLVPLQCQPSALCLKLWLWPLPLLIQGCQLARAILLYMSTGA